MMHTLHYHHEEDFQYLLYLENFCEEQCFVRDFCWNFDLVKFLCIQCKLSLAIVVFRVLLRVLKNIDTQTERCQDILIVLFIDADGNVKMMAVFKGH